MFAGYDTTGERLPLADAVLLAPVIPRSKVVCVGKNYHDHAKEMGGEAPEEPLLFLKPNTSVIGPGDTIVRPVALSEQTDFEGELAVVIGRIAKNVPAERALDYVFGYTVANDVTARDLQRRDWPVDARQGLRHLLPAGSCDRDRVRCGCRDDPDACQRRGAPAGAADRHDPLRRRHSSPTHRPCSRCFPGT
ncbi:hypothetical protein HA402_006759 [Bradysia odoriphaga]|nr:hypothetical protein HA402_006759 [Bradysia odoriphaga]